MPIVYSYVATGTKQFAIRVIYIADHYHEFIKIKHQLANSTVISCTKL